MSSAASKPLQSSGERMQGYACLAAAMALVGSTVVASKIIAAGLPFHRHRAALRAGAALLPPDHETDRRVPAPTRRTRLGVADGAGRRRQRGLHVLLITGLQRASAVDAGIILGALPLVSAALAVTLLGERPGRSTLVAIAIATAGVWLTMASPAGPEGASSLTGNALVLGAVCCEGLFILLHKRLRTPVPPLALSTIMTAIGLAASALASLLAEAPWTLALPADAVLAVAYYALAPTVGGFLLWYAGAARSNGAEAALFTAVAPVCAVLLAAGLLGEALQTRQLAGMACVLAAIALLGLSNRASAQGPR